MPRFIIFISIILSLNILLLPIPSFAHPGRTASDGCHYCRTNCASWGYTTGTRHCHGGNTSTYKPVYTKPKPKTEVVNNIYEDIASKDNLFVLVTGITDGDTIKIFHNKDTIEKVRIIGIDTPETVDPRKPVECFGKEATEKLKQLIDGKIVKLIIDPNGDKRGIYGRLIRYVYLDNKDIGAKMIKQGYAYAYLKYPFTQSKMDEYKNYEKQARENEVGLWAPGVCGNNLTNSANQELTTVAVDSVDIKLPELPKLLLPSQKTTANTQNDENDFVAGVIWGVILTALGILGYKKLKIKKKRQYNL